jgi:hypothetical protein
LRGFGVDRANVDALVQTDLEAAAADFLDPRLPLLARLPEKIIVEQMQMARVRLAPPRSVLMAKRGRAPFPTSSSAAKPQGRQPRLSVHLIARFALREETTDQDESITRTVVGYLNQSEQIADIWGAMEKAMREAKGLVFIGYSFPPSDLYFSSVLRSALTVRKSHPFVVIVNPDSMAIRARLHSRFAIPLDRMRSFSDLETYNQTTRGHVVAMFE